MVILRKVFPGTPVDSRLSLFQTETLVFFQ